MRVSLFRRWLFLSAISLHAVISCEIAVADPFSATFTSRESKRITAISAAPPFTRTYEALTQDSKDLSFQESTTGRAFLVFASKDGAIDDLGTNTCSTTGRYSIYWADKYQNLPGVCLSVSLAGGDANLDSENPKIGGSGRDMGRYVAYETDASNLASFGPSAASHQVIVHDRKWGENFPSLSKCDAEEGGLYGANRPLQLWQMSDDGKNILLTTDATNMTDNLSPACEDSVGIADVFIRDGSDCAQNKLGPCKTSVLYDRYGFHADPLAKGLLDEDSQNPRVTPDQRVVVFDTLAKTPMYFSPDTKNKKDIYYHTNNEFSRVSEAMVPFCDPLGNLAPLANEYGPADGDSERPDIDDSGRYVVFDSLATDLVVWEENPAMRCVTPGAPHPADVQYLEMNGKRQIYLYDHLNRKIELISKKYRNSSTTRAQGGNGDSVNARISRDGRFIIFEAESTDLMKTTSTSVKNVFMYDRYLEETFLVTPGVSGAGLDKDATLTHVSTTGLTVAFQTKATNAVVEGPSQGTSVGGSLPLCGGSSDPCLHVYLARNSCPLDTDGDLVPDCLDACKNDRGKTEPKLCGCGVAETDSDGDFIPDCIDACDADPSKSSAGVCGCGRAETDTDGDGSPDCVDRCSNDNSKSEPGTCGCGVADVDTDGDGSFDCQDSCPSDPTKKGTGGCPCGSVKDTPGVCGCNILDTDSNANGQADCLDPTASTIPATANYDVSKIGLGGNKTLVILRVKMQGYGGKNVYSYSLTRKGYKLKKTSKSNTITIRGLKPGTYTFSYSVTTGSGARKTTTKVSTTTVSVK